MQDFLKFLISPLLTKPEELSISDSKSAVYLTVSDIDTGRIIGKHGTIISAIRTLLRTIGMREKARVNLKIAEPEGFADFRQESY